MKRKAGFIVAGLVAIIASFYSVRDAELDVLMVGDKEWFGPSIYASLPNMSGLLFMMDYRHTSGEDTLFMSFASPCHYDSEHIYDQRTGWGTHDQLNFESAIKGSTVEYADSFETKNEYGCRPERR